MLSLKFEVASLRNQIIRLDNEAARRHALIVEMLCTPGGAQAYFSQTVPYRMPGLDAMFKRSPLREPCTDTGSVDPEEGPPLPR